MFLGLKRMSCFWIQFRNHILILIFIVIPLFSIYFSAILENNFFVTTDENNLIDESVIPDYIKNKISDPNSYEKIEQNYNPSIGKIVREFCRDCTNDESISKIAFSPDNRLLAGGTDNGKIFIWDITTDKTKQVWKNSNHKIKNLEWTIDSKILISVGLDSELNYWNVSSGESFQIDFYPKISEIANIDLSRDGKTIVIASVEKTVSLWNINGTFLKFLTQNAESSPIDIKFSPSGSLIALYTISGLTLIWDGLTSELLYRIQAGSLLLGNINGITFYKGNYIDFSFDSKLLFLARNGMGGLKIIDTKTGNEIPKLYPQEGILSVSNSKNKNLIVTGSNADTEQIKLYDYKINNTILQIQDEITIAVDFSYDGSLVASVNAGGTVRLWNTLSGTELYSFKGHTDNIIQTKFLNSSFLVSSSKDNTVRVWKNNQMIYTISNALMVSPYAVAITETQEKDILVAIGTDYGKIFLFNSSQPTSLREYAAYEQILPLVPHIRSIDFSPNSSLFVTSGTYSVNIKIWDSYSTNLVESFTIDYGGLNAYFLGNDKIISGGTLQITILDLKTKTILSYPINFVNIANLGNFDFMKMSADQTMVVAAYPWNHIAIVNLTDSNVKTFTINGLYSSYYFEFTPDNKYLLELSGIEQLLRIWDVATVSLVFSTYLDLPNPFEGDLSLEDWHLAVSYKLDDEIVILDMAPLMTGGVNLLDFDSDNMSDKWEQENSLQNYNYYDRFEDPDNDKLMNWEECIDQTNPQSIDSDGDGITDTYEKMYNMDPLKNDSLSDIDGDGMTNLYEFTMGFDSSINDSYLDSDQDGLTNLQEFSYHTNARNPDTDGDGMNDKWEVVNRLNPLDTSDANLDADYDGITNLDEFKSGTDPNNFFSVPMYSFNNLYIVLVIIITGIIVFAYYQYRKHLITMYMTPDYSSALKTKQAGLNTWFDYLQAEKNLEAQLLRAKTLLMEGSVNQSLLLYQTIIDKAIILGKINEFAEASIRVIFIEMKLFNRGTEAISPFLVKFPWKTNNVIVKEYNKIIDGFKEEATKNLGKALELWKSSLESGRLTTEFILMLQYAIIDLNINQFQVTKSKGLIKEITTEIEDLITLSKKTGYLDYTCGANLLLARLYFYRYNINKAIESLNIVKEVARKEKYYLFIERADYEAESFSSIKDTIKRGLSLKDTFIDEKDLEMYMKQMREYASMAKEIIDKEDI